MARKNYIRRAQFHALLPRCASNQWNSLRFTVQQSNEPFSIIENAHLDHMTLVIHVAEGVAFLHTKYDCSGICI